MLRSRFGDRFKTAQGTVRNAHGVATSLTGMDAIAGQFPWSWGVRPVGAVKAVLMSATGGCEGPQPSRNRWRKRLSGKDFIYMRDGALVHCNGQWISRGQAPLEILRNGGSDQGAGMIELERKPPGLAVEMQFFAKQLVLK